MSELLRNLTYWNFGGRYLTESLKNKYFFTDVQTYAEKCEDLFLAPIMYTIIDNSFLIKIEYVIIKSLYDILTFYIGSQFSSIKRLGVSIGKNN